jgi:hypothetical protein
MNTRYFCSICNTKPDQLSHHKAHLHTQKHKENRDMYEKELKYFSIYKTINPSEWLEHDEIKEMIFKEYGKELTKENRYNFLIEKLGVIDKFSIFKPEKVFFDIIDGKRTTTFVEPCDIYRKETGLSNSSNKTAYLEWCIEKILQSKETIRENFNKIQDIQNKIRNENVERIKLNRCTTIEYDILKNIRMNKYDIDKPNFVSDSIVKYACVLFNSFGVASLTNNKYSQYMYFHKLVNIETCSIMENVEGYEKKSVVSKKVWIKKSKWNDSVCTYVEDEIIKQKFRDYLLNFYLNRKEMLLKNIYVVSMKNGVTIDDLQEEIDESNVKYNEELLIVEKDIEILSKMLFESVLFKNIMKLCEFFFEHNNEIIEIWSQLLKKEGS